MCSRDICQKHSPVSIVKFTRIFTGQTSKEQNTKGGLSQLVKLNDLKSHKDTM